jgi:hypothetical protein
MPLGKIEALKNILLCLFTAASLTFFGLYVRDLHDVFDAYILVITILVSGSTYSFGYASKDAHIVTDECTSVDLV